MVTCGGFAAAFAQNFFVFLFFRFIIAMGVSGSFQNCYVLRMFLLLSELDMRNGKCLELACTITFTVFYSSRIRGSFIPCYSRID